MVTKTIKKWVLPIPSMGVTNIRKKVTIGDQLGNHNHLITNLVMQGDAAVSNSARHRVTVRYSLEKRSWNYCG